MMAPKFHWLLWYLFGSATAITVGWLASMVHASGNAPIGLISLVFGAILGATLSGIAAGLEVAGTRRLIMGTILFAIVTVLAEHAWLYLDFCRQWQQAIAAKPQAALFRSTPPSPAEYFSHELTPESAALWSLDALLIVANASATVFVLRTKLPALNADPQSEIGNPKSSDT
jgi:hypothetical protein